MGCFQVLACRGMMSDPARNSLPRVSFVESRAKIRVPAKEALSEIEAAEAHAQR
jgi:hypothetical protein